MYYSVLLPLYLDWLPVYESDAELRRGQRILVEFSHKEYVGVVYAIADKASAHGAKILTVKSLLPDSADVFESELHLWEFISQYYLCSLGVVYAAAYPKYKINADFPKKRKKANATNETPQVVAKDFTPSHPVLHVAAQRLKYYLEQSRKTVENGRSVLILLPETGFSEGYQPAFEAEFGKNFTFYSSQTTPAKKRQLSQVLRESLVPQVIMGTRSALFLPFKHLGLVIVDEEQDPSHKQTEPNPRYNARDVATVLADTLQAQLILGTFTPSLESLYNCISGKYLYDYEPTDPSFCKVQLIDIPAERRKWGMDGDYSRKMQKAVESSTGTVNIIRAYTSEEDTVKYFSERFPGRDFKIQTFQAAKKDFSEYGLTVVLNGEAALDPEDFRSDEKALQLFRRIASCSKQMVIQCKSPEHPVFQAINVLHFEDKLLEERKKFNYPPYSRMVAIKDRKSGQTIDTKLFEKDASLKENKRKLALQYGTLYILDVDPIN